MSDDESDEGRRAAKKRKASRACDRCNSQHQPCDNAVPQCSVCVRAGADCTYNRPIRKRGPRSGYTGQNGERLWAIVLQARPEIEDLVLQVLRTGTYGDTGVPNMDYYRNNDNQTELVNEFNESRLGRFLRHGESADLNLPPLDQEKVATLSRPEHPADDKTRDNASKHSLIIPPQAYRHERSMSSSSVSNSATANLHGAPQNPSEIYLPSKEIRIRSRLEPPLDQRHSLSGPDYRRSPAVQSTHLGTSGDSNEYHPHTTDVQNSANSSNSASLLHTSHAPYQRNTRIDPKPDISDLEAAYHSRWFDQIPKDTLRNLGFVPGEDTEDFIQLCANPDPIDPMHTKPAADQGEDEEVIWRRLVMRGRFV
ncbi:hypothetical protein GGR50DRAFT_568301 [Xylaria sp. CBS 124048]|nr:hypothetical protein GGR50DRAFT_568301 [Xylaria sp. CBS 124048]